MRRINLEKASVARSDTIRNINRQIVLNYVRERSPNLLRLPTAGPIALGVDIGTKQTMLATCDLAGRVIDRESFRTEPDAERTLERIVDCAGHLIRRGRGTEAIGVSVPGLVEPGKENV